MIGFLSAVLMKPEYISRQGYKHREFNLIASFLKLYRIDIVRKQDNEKFYSNTVAATEYIYTK